VVDRPAKRAFCGFANTGKPGPEPSVFFIACEKNHKYPSSAPVSFHFSFSGNGFALSSLAIRRFLRSIARRILSQRFTL
jgi:hypothetical protein